MSLIKQLTNRFTEDNSGGWGKNYEKFFIKSDSDRILPLPLKSNAFALSGRYYIIPENIVREAKTYFCLDDRGHIADSHMKSDSQEPLQDFINLTNMFEIRLGFKLGLQKIVKDGKKLDFKIYFLPVLYSYNHYRIPDRWNYTGVEDVRPKLVLFNTNDISVEMPGSYKIHRKTISWRLKFEWPNSFNIELDGILPQSIGFCEAYMLDLGRPITG